MKRKLLFVLLFTISAVACAIGLAACGDGNSDEHNLTHFVAVDATCTEDGNVEYWYCSDCGKYFSDAEATIEVSRSDIIIPAKGHTYGEWKTIKEATCTEDGERSKECVVCHHVETEVITVTGHSFSDWKDITPATCTTDGEQTRTCTKCQYKETATVYALGHDIQNNVCTRCGATATEGLRFKYVQGDGIDGVFCIGWDEEHAEGHGYSHNETEYGTLDLIIPDVYEGYPVIGVSQEWAYSFLGDLCIRSVTLPDSVIYIGDQTFQDCNYLQSVSVGPYLDYLGSGAFEDTALENTTANYENGLLYLISRDRETKWLVKAQEGLTDAVLDEDTMFVAADAFSYCDDTLSSLTFGTKIPCFYDDTFSVFNSLKNVYYNGTLEDWIKIEFYSDSANPLNNGVNLYLNGTLLTELITPTGMTEISNQFIGCISLEKVTVSEGVTEIGNMAFSGCTNLSALNLPDSLKTIGYDAFSDCTSLTSVTLPKSLESIGKDVFRGCKQLSAIQLDSSNTSFAVRDGVLYNTDFTELVYIPEGFSGILQLPDGVDLSNYNAIEYFERCENLTGIEVSENHLYHKSYNGIVYSEPDEYGSQFMYVAPGISGKIVLPDDIVIVSGFSGMDYTASGYAGRDITEIIFGANTKVIEYNAFTNCTQLVNVVIPDTVTSIGAGAFMGCTNLKSVVIGNEVVEIGYYAFKDCPLESVIFKHYTGWTVRGEDVTEEQLRNPETAAELLPDEKYGDWTNTGTYRVDFVIDGIIVKSVTYTPNDASTVVPPQIPEKEGYSASWEEYSLTGDTVVNAIYTAISYTVTFIADGETISEQTYTVEDYNIITPAVPEKTGYTGKWDYTLKEGDVGDIIVNAVYETIPYTVTFIADGEIIAEETYTVEDYDINIPEVPEKKGYDGAWGSYSLTTGNITVNAEYSIITYYVTFIADGETVAVETYTVEDYDINVPIIPEKEHYVAKWGNYVLADGIVGDFTVNAEYTAVQYTITFIVEDYEWSKMSYTIENYKDFVLPTPPERVGYEAVWEEVEWLTNDTIHALYTTIGATKGLQYALSEDGKSYSVIGYTGTDTEITIPDLYQSIPVTIIGESVFYGNYKLKNVSLPNNIIKIESDAFNGCSALIKMVIPNSVVNIDSNVFKNCPAIVLYCEVEQKPEGWIDNWNCSRPIVWNCLSNDIAEDGRIYCFVDGLYYALSGETASVTRQPSDIVNEINIPSSIQYKNTTYHVLAVEDMAFKEIYSLSSVDISEGITSIEAQAFGFCTSLESIVLPNSLCNISEDAFFKCISLQEVHTKSIEAWCLIVFSNEYSNPLYYAKKLYLNGLLLQEITVPEKIELILDYAFYNCETLEKVTFNENLREIHHYSFYGCRKLKNISIPDTVTYIGINAFGFCESLEKVVFGTDNMLTFLGDKAFENCSSLAYISIPERVESIGFSTFGNCISLCEITIPKSVIRIEGSPFSGCDNLTIYCQATTKPEGWYDDWNYNNCPVVWNCDYNHADENGFMYTYIDGIRYALKDGEAIVIKQSASLFGKVTILSTIQYNQSNFVVTEISQNAFSGCSNLQQIVIPDSVTIIGANAFYGCESLTDVNLPKNIDIIDAGLFLGCGSLKTLIIPDGVTIINESAFCDCTGLEEIFIPDSVVSINDNAFMNCIRLKEIGIPNNLSYIGKCAFNHCSITSITIPKTLTYIGDQAFYGCNNLVNIIYNDTIENWNLIEKALEWDYDTGYYTVHCIDGEITKN